jgi:hypothetical protein
MIVLLTIHGIGFQQAPSTLAAADGYADLLHEKLRVHLVDALGDDPRRLAAQGHGPVYVQSSYPPHTNQTETGLGRLGNWTTSGSVDWGGNELALPTAKIAHVALVYSGLEEQQGDVTALLGMDSLSGPVTDYATLGGLAQMAFRDLEALHDRPADDGKDTPSLRPRTDTTMHRGIIAKLLRRGATPSDTSSTGPLGILRTVEDDVAAYVTRNEHRERVREFVRDAACRLLARTDVDGVVVNGHSNGTVMGFDLVSALSPQSAQNVLALITSGCPLRKYVELLDWGRDAGNVRLLRDSWTNFWDPLDPVADPLAQPYGWKRGQAMQVTPGASMFVIHDPDTGVQRGIAILDQQVDNVRDSLGGGLRAHNYWDNDAFAVGAAGVLIKAYSQGGSIAAPPAASETSRCESGSKQ